MARATDSVRSVAAAMCFWTAALATVFGRGMMVFDGGGVSLALVGAGRWVTGAARGTAV